MSKILDEIFTNKIQIGDGEKEVTYYCSHCGVKFVATRRDLTYVICTFLLSIRDMEALHFGKKYFDYRTVIKFAIEKYNCTPSDYSLLERWKLIESMPGKNNNKYKGLSEAGRLFLDNKLMVKEFHYLIPHSDKILFTSAKTDFNSLRFQWLENKKEKEPFFDGKNNNI